MIARLVTNRRRIGFVAACLGLALTSALVASEPENDPAETLRTVFGTPAPQALLDTLGALPENGALVFVPAANARARERKRLAAAIADAAAAEHSLKAILFGDVRSVPNGVRAIRSGEASAALDLDRFPAAETHHIGIVLSADGHIRRAEPFESAGDAARLFSRANEWQRGRAIYAANCSRCHGKDGADTSYPLIKTLNGIAARYDEHTIIEETAATAIVNVRGFSEEDQFALAVYVAGL